MSFKVNNYIITDDALKKRFTPCRKSGCKGECCMDGAIINRPKIEKLKKLLPVLLPMMRSEAAEMVKKKGFCRENEFRRFDLNPKYPYYNFRTVKHRCVFFNYSPKGCCILQRYSIENNIKTCYKPPGCRVFPFDDVGNRVVVVKWKGLACLDDRKNKTATEIYKSCREELEMIIGRKNYLKLALAKASGYQKFPLNKGGQGVVNL